MAQLTASERLAEVKTALGISGNYSDDTLQFYINETIAELIDAGVKKTVAESDAAVGCIALGVNDSWNYSSGGVKHSEQFNRRLIQLCHSAGDTEAEPNMQLAISVPKQDDLSAFGWTTVAGLANKNYFASDFNATDTETIKATVAFADGTTAEGENSGTGNRRNIRINSKYVMVMPNTKYDTEQSKYCDCEGYTCVSVSVPTFCETKITLQTFDKTE